MTDTKPKGPLFHIEMDGREFKLDKLRLGEAQELKNKYGMTDLTEFNLSDPNQLTALLLFAIRRTHPEKKDAVILGEISELDTFSFKDLTDDDAESADPNAASAMASAGVEGEAGKPVTTPANAGSPS